MTEKEQSFREALARIASGFYTEKGAENHAKDILKLVDSQSETRAESYIDAFLAMALPRIGDLMQADPEDDTPEGRELMLLADLADRYERQKYPEFAGRPVKPHRSGGGGPPAREKPIEVLPRHPETSPPQFRVGDRVVWLQKPEAQQVIKAYAYVCEYDPGGAVNIFGEDQIRAVKSTCNSSASTGDDAPPSRSPTSSVECPKCRTQLAFEGDVCGLSNPEVQP